MKPLALVFAFVLSHGTALAQGATVEEPQSQASPTISRDDMINDYKSRLISTLVERRLARYPTEDLAMSRRGDAYVTIRFGADGKIGALEISRSTGLESLDAQARIAVSRAAVISRPPEALVGIPFEITVVVRFSTSLTPSPRKSE